MLKCLGIKGSLLAWFRSYLSGWRHKVVIDNLASDFLPVISGVPPGISSRTPALLDLHKWHAWCNLRGYITTLFADDSKCFHVVLGQDDGDKLQEDLNKLFELLHLWGMECNFKKCEVVRVACFKCIYEREYFLGKTKLEHVPVVKDLSILIGYNLSQNHYIDIISSRAQRILNLL